MKSVLHYLAGIVIALSFTGCLPQSGEQGKGGSSQGLFGPQIFILIAMILVFWLFFIRPQAKRAKNQKKFIEDLQRGDKIVTIAGIHGTINKVNDDGTLNIEVSPGSYIKIEKSAISMDWTAALHKAAAGGNVDKKA
jgi:preprotein translocase subunit YajC